MSVLTWRISLASPVLPGPGPHPHRDAFAGHGNADDDLGQVGPVVLALAVGAEPDRRALVLLVTGVAAVGLGGAVRVDGLDPAARVAGYGLIGLVEFEVGRGRVEEQEVHFKVEQVGDLAEDLLFQVGCHVVQPVHRPVAGIVGGLAQPVDVHATGDPAGGVQLRRGREGTVGDQREQHPFGGRVAAGAGQQSGHDLVDAQPSPQLVEHPRPAECAGGHELQATRARRGQRRARLEEPAQRRDQAFDHRPVQVVLPPEAVEHLRPGRLRRRVPLVVRQLQVAHRGAVNISTGRHTHMHVSRR
jgi:hypothetical protein